MNMTESPVNWTTMNSTTQKLLTNLSTQFGEETRSIYYIAANGFMTFTSFWMIFLNCVVIHTLLYQKAHKAVTDYFISSLSIADLVTGIAGIYISTYGMFEYQNVLECLIRFGVSFAVCHCSYTHLLAITIDRYIKVRYPLRYFTLVTKKTAIFISVTIWVYSLAIGVLPLTGMNKSYISEITGKPYCRFFGVLTNEYFVISLVGNLIVLVSTVALYVGIIIQAFKHVRNMKILTNGSPNDHSTFNDPTWNLVKTFTIIVVFTNVCWSPTVVLMMMHANGHLDHLSIKVQGRLVAYTSIGMFLNALVNPLIYAAKIGEVRTRFRKLFCCETKSSSRRKKALTTLSTVSTNDFNDSSP